MTWRANSRRSVPHSSPRWLVRPDRNWRIRLCWPALISTPSQPAATASSAAAPKPAMTAAMSLGLHPLRHLAAVDLGHPRGRPQLALAVRTGALAAGVVERAITSAPCAWQAATIARPPVAAPLGQRRSLVRPVAVVHAGALGHDDAAAAARRVGVVRGVPRA